MDPEVEIFRNLFIVLIPACCFLGCLPFCGLYCRVFYLGFVGDVDAVAAEIGANQEDQMKAAREQGQAVDLENQVAQNKRNNRIGKLCFLASTSFMWSIILGVLLCLIEYQSIQYGALIFSLSVLACCCCSMDCMFALGAYKDGEIVQEFLDTHGNLIDKAIDDSLEIGTIRMLSCKHLVEAPRTIIRRCQEMPPECFLSPRDACSAFNKGNIFVLSYGWNTREHPDPHGIVMDSVVRFLASLTADRDLSECGLFWDFASLPQNGTGGERRSDEETEVFKKGLKVMSNLYGSVYKTVVLQVTELEHEPPQDADYNTTPYTERGWCIMEDAAASLAAFYGKRPSHMQPKLIDISFSEHVVREPSSAMNAADVERRIEAGKFTGGGDKDIVLKQIKRFIADISLCSQVQNPEQIGAPFDERHEAAA